MIQGFSNTQHEDAMPGVLAGGRPEETFGELFNRYTTTNKQWTKMPTIAELTAEAEQNFDEYMKLLMYDFDNWMEEKIYPQIDVLEEDLCNKTHQMEEKWWSFIWSLPLTWKDPDEFGNYKESVDFMQSLSLPEVTILGETEFSPLDHIMSGEGYYDHG